LTFGDPKIQFRAHSSSPVGAKGTQSIRNLFKIQFNVIQVLFYIGYNNLLGKNVNTVNNETICIGLIKKKWFTNVGYIFFLRMQ